MSKALKDLRSEMEAVAFDIYSEVAYDLPRFGDHHYITAVDYIKDRLYEKFSANPLYKRVSLNAVIKTVGIDNDTAKSRQRDRAVARKAAKPYKAPKPVKVKAWDDFPPKNKGIGSF